jgi:hypothetical protein
MTANHNPKQMPRRRDQRTYVETADRWLQARTPARLLGFQLESSTYEPLPLILELGPLLCERALKVAAPADKLYDGSQLVWVEPDPMASAHVEDYPGIRELVSVHEGVTGRAGDIRCPTFNRSHLPSHWRGGAEDSGLLLALRADAAEGRGSEPEAGAARAIMENDVPDLNRGELDMTSGARACAPCSCALAFSPSSAGWAMPRAPKDHRETRGTSD